MENLETLSAERGGGSLERVVRPQLHAGDCQAKPGKKLWHTDHQGLYWTGFHYYRTPQQLLDECRSTIKDLKRNHPELDARPLRSNDKLRHGEDSKQ